MFDSVLFAGATGMLRSRIVDQWLKLPQVRVRLLVRNAGSKKASLEPRVGANAELTHGDLPAQASLEGATGGVYVMISAVQGGAA